MAEQNYMAGVNAARQRIRSGRRQRNSDVIDSLESAAAMDRMRGVDVGDAGFTGAVDTPPMRTAAMLASTGGGGRTMAQPAGLFGRRGGGAVASSMPVMKTTPKCTGPDCQFGGQTVVGEPLFDVPMQTAPQATATTVAPQPATTTVGAEPDNRSEAERLRSRAADSINAAVGLGAGLGPGAATRVEAWRAEGLGDLAYQAEASRVNTANITNAEKAAAITAETANAQNYKTRQEGEVFRATTPRGYDEDQTHFFAQTIQAGKSPQFFADAMMAQEALAGRHEAGKSVGPPLTAGERAAKYESHLRTGFAGHTVNILLTSHHAYELAKGAVGQYDPEMVGKDPVTGAPVSTVRADQLKHNPAMKSSLDALEAGFVGTNAMGRGVEWRDLNMNLEGLVFAPMRDFNRRMFLEREAKDIASYPEHMREDIVARVAAKADEATEAWKNYIREEFSMRNRMLGGGGMHDPANYAKSRITSEQSLLSRPE